MLPHHKTVSCDDRHRTCIVAERAAVNIQPKKQACRQIHQVLYSIQTPFTIFSMYSSSKIWNKLYLIHHMLYEELGPFFFLKMLCAKCTSVYI